MWRTTFQIVGRDEATGLRVIHRRRAEELLEPGFEAINWIFWMEEVPKAAEYVSAGETLEINTRGTRQTSMLPGRRWPYVATTLGSLQQVSVFSSLRRGIKYWENE